MSTSFPLSVSLSKVSVWVHSADGLELFCSATSTPPWSCSTTTTTMLFVLVGIYIAGVILPPSLPDYIEPSKTKITTLPNGVKIVSEASAIFVF